MSRFAYKLIYLGIAFCHLSANAEGDRRLFVERVESRMDFVHRLMPDVSAANPSMLLFSYDTSLSEVSGFWQSETGAKPAKIQLGKGISDLGLEAESYVRLNDRSVVSGSASFISEKRRDVKWNNCADYDRLSPYVLGDSVGGDLNSTQYRFSGSYAVSLGRWGLGASVGYRASIDYRNRDPRLKIVVSDLNVDLGANYVISDRFALGLSAGLEVYNQESDLQFYNPLNSILTYALTGLGTYYQRFSGNSSENSAYEYLGFRGGLQVRDLSSAGLVFSMQYSYYNVDQILRDFNNLTLGSVGSHEITASAGYSIKAGRLTAGARIDGWWFRRIGTENLFGSSVGNHFVKISSRQFYYSDNVNANLSIPLEWKNGSSSLRIIPAIGYVYDLEHYRSPLRELSFSGYEPAMTLGYRRNFADRVIVDLSAGFSRSMRRIDSETLTGLDKESSLGQMVVSDFKTASSDMNRIEVNLSADYFLADGMAMCIGAQYTGLNYSSNVDRHRIDLKIGLKF